MLTVVHVIDKTAFSPHLNVFSVENKHQFFQQHNIVQKREKYTKVHSRKNIKILNSLLYLIFQIMSKL